MTINLDDMVAGYIETALWADCIPDVDDYGKPLDGVSWDHGGMTHLAVPPDDRLYIQKLCALFASQAGDALTTFARMRRFDPNDGTVWHHIGHDLRLTSGGHGTGFWDRETRDGIPWDDASFFDARSQLSDLATSAPFDRTGGGDCWQVDEDTARFDHWTLSGRPASFEEARDRIAVRIQQLIKEGKGE